MNAKDFITVEGWEVPCRVGHTNAERAFPQIVRLDVNVHLPLGNAAKQDRMSAAMDYAALITKTERVLGKKTFVLIETLAETVAAIALEHPLVESVSVKAVKKVFANVQAVGAHVWREK